MFLEIVVGVYLGMVARIMLLTLDTAGRIIGLTIGMANGGFQSEHIKSSSLPGFGTTVATMRFLPQTCTICLSQRQLIVSLSRALFEWGDGAPHAPCSR